MCPNGGVSDASRSEQCEDGCGDASEHVSIVEIGGPNTEGDPDGRIDGVGDSGHKNLPSTICLDPKKNRLLDEFVNRQLICNGYESQEELNTCLCVGDKESVMSVSCKCPASSWSEKVSHEEYKSARSRRQLGEDSERDTSGKCPPVSGKQGVLETKESRLDLDGQLGFLETLIEGKDIPLDTTVSMDSQPDWLDQEKMKRGRNFALRYLLAVVYAEMVSLAILLSMKGSVQALVFTGKSNTPLTAFKRYMSTVLRVISWYESDVLKNEGDARSNMKVVRNMHASVSRRMNASDRMELLDLMTLEGRGIGILGSHNKPIQTDYEEFVGKPANGCPFAEASSLSRGELEGGSKVHLNQLELSITQFGFMGLIVLYPEKFGVHGASDQDLEAFVHLWRGLGHYLGVKDRYNFCSGSLQETRQRCRLVLDRWMKPIMSEATREWEHMYRCVVEGTSYYVFCNTYGGTLLYLSWLLGVDTPRLQAVSSWFERFLFKLQKITFCYLCKMYWVTAFINVLLRIAIWRGRKFATVWYESLEKRELRRYEKVEKGMSTRL